MPKKSLEEQIIPAAWSDDIVWMSAYLAQRVDQSVVEEFRGKLRTFDLRHLQVRVVFLYGELQFPKGPIEFRFTGEGRIVEDASPLYAKRSSRGLHLLFLSPSSAGNEILRPKYELEQHRCRCIFVCHRLRRKLCFRNIFAIRTSHRPQKRLASADPSSFPGQETGQTLASPA